MAGTKQYIHRELDIVGKRVYVEIGLTDEEKLYEQGGDLYNYLGIEVDGRTETTLFSAAARCPGMTQRIIRTSSQLALPTSNTRMTTR